MKVGGAPAGRGRRLLNSASYSPSLPRVSCCLVLAASQSPHVRELLRAAVVRVVCSAPALILRVLGIPTVRVPRLHLARLHACHGGMVALVGRVAVGIWPTIIL